MLRSPVLLVYYHPLSVDAPTITEHVNAFRQHSSFDFILLNAAKGFPKGLKKCNFHAIILHYSLFGAYPFSLNNKFIDFVSLCNCFKIAFFQDEMQYCQERFRLIDLLGIDFIYSLLLQDDFQSVYYDNTFVKEVKPTMTGFVSDDLIEKSSKFHIPFSDRSIDVGYRARQLPFYFGQGAREKTEIAEKFISHVTDPRLALDISTKNSDRIYGNGWHRFVANCRFMLGQMGGTSIFDTTGEVKSRVDEYMREFPDASFLEVHRKILFKYENKIYYRQITPRFFECAALKVCMILYRDDYQGILVADRHYIALEKDFSNIESVLAKMRDVELVERITECAYEELIESGRWHYKKFIEKVDQVILRNTSSSMHLATSIDYAERQIKKDQLYRNIVVFIKFLFRMNFPGRMKVKSLIFSLGAKICKY